MTTRYGPKVEKKKKQCRMVPARLQRFTLDGRIHFGHLCPVTQVNWTEAAAPRAFVRTSSPELMKLILAARQLC